MFHRKGGEKDSSKSQTPPSFPPNSFSYHVQQIKIASENPFSLQSRYSIKLFLNYLNSQYKLQRSINNEQTFLKEIFASTSLTSLNNNPTHYLLFLVLFIEANIGSKLSKAMRIARELPQLPPSNNPLNIIYLDKILKMLTNKLGTTLNLIIQPLRDKILAWFCSPNEETILSSMNLLEFFFQRFPYALASSFESIKSLLLRALQHRSHLVTQKATMVLVAALKHENGQLTQNQKSLCSDIVKNLMNEHIPPSYNFVQAMLSVLDYDPSLGSAFEFEKPPYPDIYSKNQWHLIGLIPISLSCSPEIFTESDFGHYFSIFEKIDYSKSDKFVFQSLGHFCFLLGQRIQSYQNQRLNILKKIRASHISIKYKSFALLSLLIPRDTDVHIIVDSILEDQECFSAINSFIRYCEIWPKKAAQLRTRIFPILNSKLLLNASKEEIVDAFTLMTKFNFISSELSIHLLINYRKFFNDNDFGIRKSCVSFLLSQQSNFPEIKIHLISFISMEVCDSLRLFVLESIEPSVDHIESLYAFLHDRNTSVRYLALRRLCAIEAATPLLSDFISEMVQGVDHNEELNGHFLNCLLIATKMKSSLVRPYAQFLLGRLLKVQTQKSSSLLLIANLLQFSSPNTDLYQLANVINANLSLHASAKRINATLELFMNSLKFTNLRSLIIYEQPSIMSRLFELSKNRIEEDLLINVIERIGPINTATMKVIMSGSKGKLATQSLLGALTLINQKSDDNDPAKFMGNTAVFVSLSILLNIMNEESLSTLHSSAIEALLAILLTYKEVGEEVEDLLLEKIHSIIVSSGSGTVALIMQNIIQLLTVFGDKLAPLLPHIIEIVCNNWGKLDTVLLLRTIEWISVRIPNAFAPYTNRIVTLFLSDLDTQTPEVVNEIFQKFISFGNLMQFVDYLIIPKLLSWIEIQANNDLIVTESLITLKETLIYSNCHRYSSEIIHSLKFVAQINPRIYQSIANVLAVVAIELREQIIVYLQDFAIMLDMSVQSDFTNLINSIVTNQEIPEQLIEKYGVNKNISSKTVLTDELDTKVNIKDKHNGMELKKGGSNRIMTIADFQLPPFRNPAEDWDSYEWSYWFDNLVTIFLNGSPLKAITSCAALADKNISVRNTLFPISYSYCCALQRTNTTKLMEVLSSVLVQPQVPTSIIRHFIIVVEHLEINNMMIPIPWSVLGEKATASGLITQALRYTEYAFIEDQKTSAEDLIFLNLNLGLHLAANGVLRCSNLEEFPENLYEKLELWDESLQTYNNRLQIDPTNEEFLRGKMNCLEKLSRYKDLEEFIETAYNFESEIDNDDSYQREKMKSLGLRFAASAAYHLFKMDKFSKIAEQLDDSISDNLFYIIILKIMRNDLDAAEKLITKLNSIYASQLFPAISDEYDKCFNDFCQASLLSEIQEIIEMKRNENKLYSAVPSEREVAQKEVEKICNEWKDRFEQLRSTPKALFEMICVRSLYLNQKQLMPYFYAFLEYEASAAYYAYQQEHFNTLTITSNNSSITSNGSMSNMSQIAFNDTNGLSQLAEIVFDFVDRNSYESKFAECLMGLKDLSAIISELPESSPLYLKYLAVYGDKLINDGNLKEASVLIKKTIEYMPSSPVVWMKWSKINIALYDRTQNPDILTTALEATLTGLSLSPQNPMLFTLRVLSIISQHGSTPLYILFESYLTKIPIHYWISLLPQIIAKLSCKELNVTLERLLLMMAASYPQNVLYSLMVPFTSETSTRGPIARRIINTMRMSSPILVEEAILFASEMKRIASIWWERWISALDESSKQFVLHQNPEATVKLLLPLHELISRPPETLFEVSFISQFGSLLLDAEEFIRDYQDTKNILAFHRAWSIFVNIYNSIKPFLTHMNEFNLADASVLSNSMRNTELIIPGTKITGQQLIKIESICPEVVIINSKQRPRRISMRGSDGSKFSFLLKPNEDTRLDERVMQLFNYISDVIKSSQVPFAAKLNITTYHVIPLTKKVGLIGWVNNTQTLFEVIRHYRQSIRRNSNAEMVKIATHCPNYDTASVEQKARAFLIGIKATPGDDIKKVTLKYATDSSDWLDRRTTYTTSLASTSMAGYILGLGDRHLSNIMVKNRTMKLIHIDFGDCFEVAKYRRKFPEKVPFRLTPLMVNGLEVSKIEGTFRACCENVMEIMKENGEQIMALLEAFIYDPLLQWTIQDSSGMAAIKAISRIRDKLTGNDFVDIVKKQLTVNSQVDLLIQEATNPRNLCQMFQGWCPFW